MSKSDSDVPPVARSALEDILTRALLAYFTETPVRQLAPTSIELAPSSGRRLMVVAHPGLASDCLCGTLSEHGYSVALSSLYEPIAPDGIQADLVILSVSQFRPETLATIRQRIEEIHAAAPRVPAMAMIENVEREEARNLSGLGLAAVVVGPLSAKIALATIHLVLLGGIQVSAEICLGSEAANGRIVVPKPAASLDAKPAASLDSEPAASLDPPPDDNAFVALGNFTDRELALLTRLRNGMQNKVIAHELGIAESTVKVHLRNIMTKLHASNRTQVASILAGNASLLGPRARLPHDLDPVPVGNGSTPR